MLAMSMAAGAMLLFWTWLANRAERLALYGAAAFIISGVGVVLIGLRSLLPLALSVVAGNVCAVAGSFLLFVGLRLFNGGRVPWLIVFGLPAFYLATMAAPSIYANAPLRFSLASTLVAVGYMLAAIEVLRCRDGLRSRLALGLALLLQSAFTMARVPMAMFADPPLFTLDGFWVAAITVESTIFVQVISYLVISLPKERVEQALQRAALTDSLTGLPNRRAFHEFATQALSLAARRQRSVSLISFDLDRFKLLNDTYGHAAGDAALTKFAEVLAGTLRESDICGRIGGEEFAAILLETGEADACTAAERVVTGFASQTIEVDGRILNASVSAGVACCADGSSPLEDLLAQADRALYSAKQAGRNRTAVMRRQSAKMSLAI
jgi:diguanylate cyclase (GGDEF)-like protein